MSSQERSIGLGTAVIIAMNAMIGASVFAFPSKLQIEVGPAAIFSYVLVTALVLVIALAFARLTSNKEADAPFYDYAYAWGGRVAGLLSTVLYTSGLIMVLGLLGSILGTNMHAYIPSLSPVALGSIVIALLATLHLFGVSVAQAGQYVLIVLKFFPLIAIALLSLVSFNTQNFVPFAPHGISSVLLASQVAILGFFGFETIPSLGRYVKDPLRTIPRAMILAVLLVGAVYTLFTFCIVGGLPRHLFTSSTMRLSAALVAQMPCLGFVSVFIDWAIIVTIIGAMHSMLWGVSALLHASVERVKMSFKLSQRMLVLVVSALVILSCVLVKNTGLFFALATFSITCAYGMVVACMLGSGFKRKRGDLLLALLALCSVLFVMYCSVSSLL